MLISLGPIGGEGSVNPADVTSIETTGRRVTLWVRGHAGYGTYSMVVTANENTARCYLNDPVAYLRAKHCESIAAVLTSLKAVRMPAPPEDWRESLSDAIDCLRDVYNEMALVPRWSDPAI